MRRQPVVAVLVIVVGMTVMLVIMSRLRHGVLLLGKALCNYTGAPQVGHSRLMRDEVGELIAHYVVNVSGKLDARAERAAKAAVIDSMAVAIAALRHPAAQNARKHAYRFANGKGCVIWGTAKRASPSSGALQSAPLPSSPH